ncbi:uncharacterized protein OCT59_009066 [Rhizophagus irregularis]|uniref:uncharacterized protein n=1 Tax=Rhizophagus irregularis TaxID=588596 RepID=UPI00332F4EE1|nr:hypothetical protein OCT59_009066 [Rhizophagus irregularis]
MSVFQLIRKESKSAISSTSYLIKAIKPKRSHKKTNLLSDIDDVDSIKSTKITRSLSIHSNLYYWILKTYEPDSRNTQRCFEYIRIWMDLNKQESRARTSYIMCF